MEANGSKKFVLASHTYTMDVVGRRWVRNNDIFLSLRLKASKSDDSGTLNLLQPGLSIPVSIE